MSLEPQQPTYSELWQMHKKLWLEFINLTPEEKNGGKGWELDTRMRIIAEQMAKGYNSTDK